MNMYLVPKLVAYNFPTDKFPTLKVRNIGETKDLQMWASAISNLASQDLITLDTEFEQWVREQIDGPLLLGERPVADGTQAPAPNDNKGGVRTNDPKQGQGNVGKGNNPQ
jgi:hypothetical protein